MGGTRGQVFRKIYKGHMNKTKEGGIRDGRWGWLGWGRVVGRKWRQLYLNNKTKNFMIISMDFEKVFDKISTPYDKNTQKTGNKERIPQHIKGHI